MNKEDISVAWEGMSKIEILDKISADRQRMTDGQERLWESIKIEPEKWIQNPWGNEGGGFWAVGLIGKTVIWYNDIEEGFNRSRYIKYGMIDEYWCNQDDLEHTMHQILTIIETGEYTGLRRGPPEPLA